MTKLVRAAVLTNYLEVTQYLGFNPRDVLAAVGLSRAQLQAPEHRIQIDAAVRLLEDSAAASGCQTFGLSMAESRQLSDFGVVSLLLSHQRTLRDALQVVVDYRHLMNDSLAIFIEEAGKMVIIREEVVTETPMPSRQATELAIGVMFRLCSALLGSHWQEPIALALYALNLLLGVLSYWLLWHHVSTAGILEWEELHAMTGQYLDRFVAVSSIGFGLAIVTAFLNAPISLTLVFLATTLAKTVARRRILGRR